MRLNSLSTLVLAVILSGCATVQTVCPKLPDPPQREQLGPSFQDRMQNFLQGNLPEPTGSERPSKSATPGSSQ